MKMLWCRVLLCLCAAGFISDARAGLFRRDTDDSRGLLRQGLLRRRIESKSECNVPLITSGYGANDSFEVEQKTLDQPEYRLPVEVFLPKGAEDRRPVIFFSHGYGPNMSEGYTQLIDHLVSRGMIVVYAPYPMLRSTSEERYEALWNGFVLASQKMEAQMDLTRVGFVGHSFGGGANPEMAYRGFVQKGWGSQGAFMMELAPWYSYLITDARLKQFPERVMHVTQVYDRDTINDHRMAIDIHSKMNTPVNLFLMVHTRTVDGCELEADHATPGRNDSLALKQYAVFRPLDMLADAAFGSADALKALNGIAETSGYQPVEIQTDPTPIQPETFYTFPWSGNKNPRAH